MTSAPPATTAGIRDAAQLELLKGSISVLVTVGTDLTTWTFPKALLTAHSTFFKAALHGSFAEATSNAVTLPEDEPTIFQSFVQYLYLGQADFDVSPPTEVAQAWILGDMLGCDAYCQQTLQKLILMHRMKKFTPELVRLSYANSPPGSDLRKYMILGFLLESRHNMHKESTLAWAKLAEDEAQFSVDVVRIVTGGSFRNLVDVYGEGGKRHSDADYLAAWCEAGVLKKRDVQPGFAGQ